MHHAFSNSKMLYCDNSIQVFGTFHTDVVDVLCSYQCSSHLRFSPKAFACMGTRSTCSVYIPGKYLSTNCHFPTASRKSNGSNRSIFSPLGKVSALLPPSFFLASFECLNPQWSKLQMTIGCLSIVCQLT